MMSLREKELEGRSSDADRKILELEAAAEHMRAATASLKEQHAAAKRIAASEMQARVLAKKLTEIARELEAKEAQLIEKAQAAEGLASLVMTERSARAAAEARAADMEAEIKSMRAKLNMTASERNAVLHLIDGLRARVANPELHVEDVLTTPITKDESNVLHHESPGMPDMLKNSKLVEARSDEPQANAYDASTVGEKSEQAFSD